MPRKQRMYMAGMPCHVIQRGNNREACFFTEQDYLFYLDCLADACHRYQNRGQNIVSANIDQAYGLSRAVKPQVKQLGSNHSIPETSYFAVGKVAKDQGEDYFKRIRMGEGEVVKWLAPNLGFEV